jgi:hypothetical protein
VWCSMAASDDDSRQDPHRTPVKRQRVRRNTRKRDQKSEEPWLDAEAKEKLDKEVRSPIFTRTTVALRNTVNRGGI